MITKKILITGGYSGIGLELSKILFNEGHKIGLIIKNENRKLEFLREYPEFNTLEIDIFLADLSNQEQIIQVANDIRNRWGKIDILFNNAGVLLGEKLLSAQGNEMHFEINTLAHYLLTLKLKPLLQESGGAIVINTATDGLHYIKTIDIQDLFNPKKFKKLFGSYTQSKLALVLLMNKISDEWFKNNIRIINVSPGGNKTKLTEGKGMPAWMTPLMVLLYKNPIHGAKLLYGAAFNESYKDKTGIYLQNGKIQKIKLSLNEVQESEILKRYKISF
ncbi:MAG: SDR family NAD(P)-dependent oxidoreductase [Calditrichaceae bacterium]|nr:SDR family NAD(P)-dependent oxidoreductase [Calditrichaceae bacterium]MBN2710288.1 SDR family NAD(P)-dependent oxidoreductase [Calditrichaceae bacterium]RQV93907.1 MAG: SDR family NAD(P)-dependent oxidoreductase [Calditrichota bacterium]